METLEFLGGKYRKTEQVVPGPVQTFRASETATGNDVFVHRVSMQHEQEEQAALLRMLTTALLRSPDARKLVLDFGEDQGFWYVVTVGEPKCLVLREWLQFELNRASAQPAKGPSAVIPEPPTGSAGPGEFTRIFNAAPQANEKPPSAAPTARPEKHTSPPPGTGADDREPGEFTRVFQSFKPQAPPVPPPAQPTQPQTAKDNEPGEFTRLFQGGLPGAPGKSNANPDAKRHDRISRGGFVQRPNTPMPPMQQRSSDSSEFTRLFSHPPAESSKPKELFSDYAPAKPAPVDPFSGSHETPKRAEAEPQEPGEYTRIFGGAASTPAGDRVPAAPPSGRVAADDPLRSAPAPVHAAPIARGPSEYTMVIRGNGPLESAAAPPTAPAAAQPAVPPPLPQVNIPKPNLPKPPEAPPAAAQLTAAAGSNKKLAIFFAILVVVAAILVAFILFTVKK